MSLKVLILGCGDIGMALGRELLALGHEVTGVRRHPDALAGTGIKPLALDLSRLESHDATALPDADYVIYTPSADRFDEDAYRRAYPEGLRRALAVLSRKAVLPRYLLFVSSTGVYGQQEGEVIDEQSPTEPERFSGLLMREAEQALIEHALPGSVVRFSGIYGPGRDRLIRQVLEGRLAAVTPLIYSNRIHRDDCVGVLMHLIARHRANQPLAPVYLASDCEPVTLHEVMRWLGEQLEVTPTDTMQAPLRRRASKRCDNTRLLESGYRFRYPTFRQGYRQVLEQGGFLTPKAT